MKAPPRGAALPFVLVVHPSLPVQSIGDLVKLAKAQKLSYASTGTGAVPHMAGELLKSMTGIEMTHVPYRGVTQTMTDVIAGHVQMTFASPDSAMGAIKDGRVRALGVSSLTRVPVLPDVPPQRTFASFIAIFASCSLAYLPATSVFTIILSVAMPLSPGSL